MDAVMRLTGGRRPGRAVWLGLASAQVAEMAARAGAEVGVVDGEHGQIGPESMADMVRALQGAGARAVVRVPGLVPGAIKHALDAGADGVIVPYVESAAEARAAVEAFHFPPLGKRGAAFRVIRGAGYGADAGYRDAWRGRGALILQIESRAGLAAAPAIAATEGVAMLLFGPSDFAADAGLAMTDPALLAAWRGVEAAARAAGRGVMGFPWPGMDAAAMAAGGCDLVAVGSDVVALTAGLAAAVEGA